MDNKKWYKRFGTLFWWVFTILPLLVAFVQFTGYHLTFNSGITSGTDLANYHDLTSGSFYSILNSSLNTLDYFNISFFKSTFINLFRLVGVDAYNSMGKLMSFMVSVQVFHLIFDLFAWLPMFFHKMLEKSNIGE